MTSSEPTDSREVWLSGTETIHMVSDLLDPTPQPSPNRRGSGRTTRLASEYIQLLLKIPDHKVVIEDHHSSLASNRRLARIVGELLDVLGVGYEVGHSREYDPDANLQDKIWIRVYPSAALTA